MKTKEWESSVLVLTKPSR